MCIYSPSAYIFKESEPRSSMALLVNGFVEVVVGDILITKTNEPGTCFDATASFDLANPRTASLRSSTVGDSIVNLLSIGDFKRVLEKFPAEMSFFDSLSKDVANCQKKNLEVIRGMPAFAGAENEFLELLTLDSESIDLRPEKVLDYEEESDRSLYIVKSGSVLCRPSIGSNKDETLSFAQCCGFSAAIGLTDAGHFNLRCNQSDTKLLKIPRRSMLHALTSHLDQAPYLAELAESSPEAAGGLKSPEDNDDSIREIKDTGLSKSLSEVLKIIEVDDDIFLETLNKHLKPNLYLAGQTVMAEGASEDFLVILLRGSVIVDVGGVVVDECSAPQCLGEVAALGMSQKRTATIKAQSICAVKLLHRDDLVAAMSPYPAQLAALEALAQERLHALSIALEAEKADGNLAKINVFEGSSPEFLERICCNLETRTYLPNQTIVQQGEEGTCMYILLYGTADVLVTGAKVGEMQQGTTFGELVFLGEPVRTATVKATTICVCRVIHFSVLTSVFRDFPAEREKIEQLGAARRRVTQFMVGFKSRRSSQKEEDNPESPSSGSQSPRKKSLRQLFSRPSQQNLVDESADSESMLRAKRKSQGPGGPASGLDDGDDGSPPSSDSRSPGRSSLVRQKTSELKETADGEDKNGASQVTQASSSSKEPTGSRPDSKENSREASASEETTRNSPRNNLNESSNPTPPGTASSGRNQTDGTENCIPEEEDHEAEPTARSVVSPVASLGGRSQLSSVRSKRFVRHPVMVSLPQLPPVAPHLYSEGRQAQKVLTSKFRPLIGSTAPPDCDEDGLELSPKKPARQQPSLDLCRLKRSDTSLWLSNAPSNQHLKRLRCRPTYTSPPPPLHEQPRRIRIHVAHDVPTLCKKSQQALVIARELNNLASATLRINQRKSRSVSPGQKHRPSSAPVSGSAQTDYEAFSSLLMSHSTPDLKKVADIKKILEEIDQQKAGGQSDPGPKA